jgi:excisionase family DNA binding protein
MDAVPNDLISTQEAAALVRPPRGKATHVSTIIRWIVDGRLRGWRQGRWWMVSRAELLEVTRPVRVVPFRPAKETKAQRRWAAKVLASAGL